MGTLGVFIMVNFNGKIGHIDVPVLGNYDNNTSQRTTQNADDSIFNFDTSGINSLRVQNSKQDMNPDEFAQQYAEEHNITFEEAQNKLRDIYGEPEKPEPNIFAKHFANQNNISEDEAQFVLEKLYGMTDNIFRF